MSNQVLKSAENLAALIADQVAERDANADADALYRRIIREDLAPFSLQALSEMINRSRSPMVVLNDALTWIKWVRQDRDFELADSLNPWRHLLRRLLHRASINQKLVNSLRINSRSYGREGASLNLLIDRCVSGNVVFAEPNDDLVLPQGPLNPLFRGDICVACSAAHVWNENTDAGTLARVIVSTLDTRVRTRQPGKEEVAVHIIPVSNGTVMMTGEHVMALAGDATSHGGQLTGRTLQESERRSVSYLHSALNLQPVLWRDCDGKPTMNGAPDGSYVAMLELSDPLSFNTVGGLHAVAVVVRNKRVKTYDALRGTANIVLSPTWAIYQVC